MKIGIFTASTPIGALCPKRAQRAIEFLEAKGHEVIKGNLFISQQNYRSGTIEQRAAEINALIDQNVDLLLSAIGGWNTSSILPFLNYQKINQQKMVVCGFSDSTALLSAIAKKCPQARVIYGPALFPNFGEFEAKSSETSYQILMDLIAKKPVRLTGEKKIYVTSENWENWERPRRIETNSWKVWNPEKIQKASGKLFGGNGSTLVGIMGSKFSPPVISKGILLVEDTKYPPAEIEKIFNSLLLNNFFQDIKGIILGKTNGHSPTDIQPIDILTDLLSAHGLIIPIIYDVNISHVKPMLGLELGKKTTIDFEKKQILQNQK